MTRGRLLSAAAIFSIGLAALILWLRSADFWAIDSCLDSGGAWDYEMRVCRH